MRILCVSRFHQTEAADPAGFNARLATEFARAGHQFAVANPEEFEIVHQSSKFPLHHPEHDLSRIDLFHHALRSDDEWGWEVVACLRDWHKPIARPPRLPPDDKVTLARMFARAGISVPETRIVSNLAQAQAAAIDLGYPLVGKARHGSQGRTVRMIEDEAGLVEFAASAHEIAGVFLLQQTILPLGRDIRAFVVGGQVIATMERHAAVGDFRSNYSLSGIGEAIELTAEETQMAIRAAEIYNTPYAGVDLMRGQQGTVVLEINKAPALRGIEQVTGVNVAAAIVRHFEKLLAI